ncbi:hypothetical protein [Falsiroseomonas tokyonensis]|uniref:Uncharacterized protein n=1 Tax=Falsiroseomonas tokyonensis TaxID=430521 RepID=A0ABV7BP38_9PROT|nr:hypothetical protein [Falsiroseomonas tokyonensis]MBU8536243.1 hypothetical protein [Falsiroseomonas tokyonensis]
MRRPAARPDPAQTRPPRVARTGLLLAVPLALPLLAGCQIGPTVSATAGPVLVASGASLILTGRTPVDHVASWATGRDCSLVRVERRESWCAPEPSPPTPQPFCTRSLGAADCWTVPPLTGQRGVADPP